MFSKNTNSIFSIEVEREIINLEEVILSTF
jgi:hypothetical protein